MFFVGRVEENIAGAVAVEAGCVVLAAVVGRLGAWELYAAHSQLLISQRARPKAALDSGFAFQHATLHSAIDDLTS